MHWYYICDAGRTWPWVTTTRPSTRAKEPRRSRTPGYRIYTSQPPIAQKGETAKAAAAKAQLLKYQPGYTIARFKALRISDNPIYWQQAEAHIFTGLRRAGIPEQ